MSGKCITRENKHALIYVLWVSEWVSEWGKERRKLGPRERERETVKEVRDEMNVQISKVTRE